MPTPCDVSAALTGILALRSSSEYQAAELMRRQYGAAWMASSPPDSEAQRNVCLLIVTWESIAERVLDGCPPAPPHDDRFFETNPVGHMWVALKPGIDIIRGNLGPQYAANFESLNRKYRSWIRKMKTKTYETAALQGINAMFG